MQITDHFVFLHLPKTGGTFVTKQLKSIYSAGHEKQVYTITPRNIYRRDTLVTHPEHGKLLTHKNKHGTRSQIPLGHRKKSILTTMRNPFDWYVSQFFFGWWKREEYKKFHSRIPANSHGEFKPSNIEFSDYMTFIDEAFPSYMQISLNSRRTLGYMTRQFLHQCLKKPRLAKLDRHTQKEELMEFVSSEIIDIHFLRQENLNMDLYQYLKKWGYNDSKSKAIPEAEKVLPAGSSRTDHVWQNYYSKELAEKVIEKDWLLFQLFPEYMQNG